MSVQLQSNRYLTWSKAILVTTSFMVSTAALSAKKEPKEFLESVSLDIPFRITHPVAALNLAETPGKELLILGVDDNKNRMLAIYAQTGDQGSFELYDQAIIPSQFLSYDFHELDSHHSGNVSAPDEIEPTQNIYFLTNHNVVQYQLKAQLSGEQFKEISSLNSIYLQDEADYLSSFNFVDDLNGDGIEDIFVQDFNQLNVLIGQKDGSVIKQSLPVKSLMRFENRTMSYADSRRFQADLNLDSKTDLVIADIGKLIYFQQTESGTFALNQQEITINEQIYALEWWFQKDENGNDLDQSDLDYRKFSELIDVNGDDVVDMIVRHTKSSGVLDRVNDYEVYLGSNKEGQLLFKPTADSVIKAEGTLAGIEFTDINNDGKQEVLVSSFDIGLSQIISALLAGSVDQDVLVFSMDENEMFMEDAIIEKEVELTFSLSSGSSGEPVVRLEDITGDGFKDLLLSNGTEQLKLYTGKEGENLFSRKAMKQKVILPKDGGMVLSDDLNADGKTDLILRYGRQDAKELRQKVTLLLGK